VPLSTFYGATIDRSVPGQITLALDGVVVTMPWDGGKPSKADVKAAFFFLNQYLAQFEFASGSVWDDRCQYARFAWKALEYADIAASLPGNQRKPWTDKAARMATFRDQFRALAGE